MVNNQAVRFTFAAVIIFFIFANFFSCNVVYAERDASKSRTDIVERNRKHVEHLKVADPEKVATVKKRLKSRMRGRRPDQSNERNLWVAHPKKEDWYGPDTDEVVGVVPSLGI